MNPSPSTPDRQDFIDQTDWTGPACNGISLVAVAVIVGAFFTLVPQLKDNRSELTSLIFRSFAALALYGQVDHYRRKVLERLPEPEVMRGGTVACGLALGTLASFVAWNDKLWFFFVAVMLFVIFLRNCAAWLYLRRWHRSHILLPTFGRWTLASFGYCSAIFAISPLHYTLKLAEPRKLLLPGLGWSLPATMIDVLPALIIFVSMTASITRLRGTLEQAQKAEGV